MFKGNVAVCKGLFLELPSGHVIVIAVYIFLSTVSSLPPLLLQEQVPHILSTKKDGQPARRPSRLSS